MDVASGIPDFGYAKQGTVVTQNFDLLNDGDDDVYIESAGLTGLAAPFAASNFVGFSNTVAVVHNGHATFTVKYTAPAAGTVSNQTVTVKVTDARDASVALLPIHFSGTSTATDPAHYAITTSTGAALSFGQLTVGQAKSETVTLTNDGVIPLRFTDTGISVRDLGGAPISGFALTASSFGSGAVYAPGASATFELTYTPTDAQTVSGVVHIVATQATADPEPPSVIETADLTASAVAPVVTPTPTPTPTTTPTSTAVPAVIVGEHNSTPGSLASTGTNAQDATLVGGGITALGLGALAALALIRRRRDHV